MAAASKTKKPAAAKGKRKAAPKAKAPAKKQKKAVAATDGLSQPTVSEPVRGRPSRYTTELGDLICARLADGETLIAICRDEDMPSERAVRSWALDPDHEFSPKYTRARELGYLHMADDLLAIADDGSNDFMDRMNADGTTARVVDHEHVQRSRLRFEARKWLLSKALPKIYGERLSAEVSGPNGAPLIPENASSREVARAVLDILREAKTGDGQQG